MTKGKYYSKILFKTITRGGKMDYQNFILEKENKVLTITLNRPPANSISTAAVFELDQILDEAENDQEVRVIIITGKDREDKPEKSIFCAGADITEFGQMFTSGKTESFIKKGQDTYTRIERFKKPIIACLNGHALGGGCELAIACHFRIMAETATIGTPEINLGLLPGYGGTTRLPRLIPKAKALEMLVAGVRFSAEESLRYGLVNKVVKKGEELKTAKEFAKNVAINCAPIAAQEILKIVALSDEITPEESFKMERESFNILATSKDAMEGVMAFMQKRPPDFKGE